MDDKRGEIKKPKGKKNDTLWWVITILLFCTGGLWWAGLALLLLNVNGHLAPIPELLAYLKSLRGAGHRQGGPVTWEQPDSAQAERERAARSARAQAAQQESAQQEREPWQQPEPAAQAGQASRPRAQAHNPERPVRNGALRTVFGALLATLGLLCCLAGGLSFLPSFFDAVTLAGAVTTAALGGVLLLAGLALLISGGLSRRKKRRFARLLQTLGGAKALKIQSLADMLGRSYASVLRDLDEMLGRGYFDGAWIDQSTGWLLLQPRADTAPNRDAQEQRRESVSEAERVLRQIRADNELIADAEISRKIDRIEELTRKIFAFQEQHPDRAGELRSFMNYYLPQTLKLLETYARLEAQGVEGENIAETKRKISAMLDKLADGYERQLDKLFSADVIDITADIRVMEQMLEKDGLAGDDFALR